ncbi:carbohydrate-binding protein [Ilyomonas limi]|uniref:Carbohydrate-binding protein n=1 Tax=Ilyomonas limi TaxID=2575867 RepID=A0A4U3L1Q6_9BACT|nr:ThuA domain-containing protein [Ilyomonas limi]TKK68810.1 carbohydrate-binding protein [Ilyomonas limi]
MRTIVCIASLLFIIAFAACNNSDTRKVLVFTKTKGYHHESIPAGIAAIEKIGKEQHFEVDTTTDAGEFNDDNLKQYKAVVFLSTTGNILNSDQQVALQRYMEAGGGFMGIHAAADAEYKWGWYNKLVGAYFKSHPQDPNVRKATVVVTDTANPAMKGLPQQWERTDEWYNYKNIEPDIHVLARLDEDTYEGGENGRNHPIAWYHTVDGGRAFYTGGGHTTESYSEPLFLQHLAGGIQYAMGPDSVKLDYSKAYATKAPEENRFTKVILTNDLNEPMEIAVTPSNYVYVIERSGNFYAYNPKANTTKLVYKFGVMPDSKQAFGNGLLGMTIDPDFATNKYVYFFYTPNKEPIHQNISRFKMIGEDSLDVASEKVIIQVPLDPEVSAHTGGSLAWDKNKNLFISTGDNTVPFESDGYAPLDERPGRKTFDAQRSASNPADLRGKVLRIHPEADGSYTIPAGNLFAKGTAGTRPEIYTMGCRNPYRIAINQETSTLYWGEVGPDAGEDSRHGPRGYDEFNQAKKPGYYGWPYFVGNNRAYHDSDFATKQIGALFNVNGAVNTSPNNTGMQQLPPATAAMIYYPYSFYDTFPDLGEGGRTAIAGAFYHYNKSKAKPNSIPEYYDKALFVMDWMRNWIFALRFDENENYKRMEAFMPLTGDFRRPIDMDITPDGVMYVLEYGSVYGADNDDARLVRIDYNGGNRAPIAKISANDSIGLVPLKVSFNSNNSYDNDEDDQLKYEWKFEGDKVGSTEPNPTYTFNNKGVYKVILKVTDPSGLSSVDTMEVKVGNTMPQIAINTTSNSTFYFDNTALNYNVDVKDKEDANIDAKKIQVKLEYVPEDAGTWKPSPGAHGTWTTTGKDLIMMSDCKACHQFDTTVIGPAFTAVAQRYQNKPGEIPRLANKIITGGSGVWGEHYMNAHPQLSKDQTTAIVKYILSLTQQQTTNNLPASGTVPLKAPAGKGGTYVLTAAYTDAGSGVVPLTNTNELILRPAKIEAEDADVLSNIRRDNNDLGSIHNKSYFVLKGIDLKDIKSVTYNYSSRNIGATLEVHADSPKGAIISTLNYEPTGDWNKFKQVTTSIQDPGGKHNLYFVFKKDTEPNRDMFSLDWLKFNK